MRHLREVIEGVMNILKYFSYNKEDNYQVYRLNDLEVKDFLASITEDFRHCYIIDNELKKNARKNGISKGDYLKQCILPDVGKIKSGDFGEMLSCFFIEEYFANKNLLLFCPRKWLWKEDRNKASPYTDVVGFHCENVMNPSENDFIVSVESKMEATKTNKNRIQEAIDGANTDRLSRLAKTLRWLKEKYERDGIKEKKEFVERYSDPVERGTYKKLYKAFAILDKKFEGDQFSLPIKDNENITIIVITMKNLKEVYEENLARIIESA
jgi:hypothetical protein